MKCPACPTVSLVMTDRSGIEIDYCPDCRGVWLDRGELDKIIERATPAPAPSAPAPPAPARASDVDVSGRAFRRDRDDDRGDDFDDDDDRDRDRDRSRSGFFGDGDGRPTAKRRKKGLLGDLFDF